MVGESESRESSSVQGSPGRLLDELAFDLREGVKFASMENNRTGIPRRRRRAGISMETGNSLRTAETN